MKRIVVTGAGGQIAYSLLFRLASGELFGKEEKITLVLRDVKEAQPILEGLAMELEDCAFPLLSEIKISFDPADAFQGVDCAFLVGAKPRGPGMERKDLLLDNAKIFVDEGRALGEAASTNVKVLVVGNPCNTNCLIAMHHAPKIPRRNFAAMMQLDENRARALLAKRSRKPVESVTSVTIWGNHSATQVPDFTHAKIDGNALQQVITDRNWLERDFIEQVQKRGAAIIAARGKSSAASAASAAIDAMRALTGKNPWFSTAILAEGNSYGIDPGIVFGFPCKTSGKGELEIIDGLSMDPFIQEKIKLTQKELLEEKECIKQLLT